VSTGDARFRAWAYSVCRNQLDAQIEKVVIRGRPGKERKRRWVTQTRHPTQATRSGGIVLEDGNKNL